MRSSRKFHLDDFSTDLDVDLHIDELAKHGCWTAILEPSELLRHKVIIFISEPGLEYGNSVN